MSLILLANAYDSESDTSEKDNDESPPGGKVDFRPEGKGNDQNVTKIGKIKEKTEVTNITTGKHNLNDETKKSSVALSEQGMIRKSGRILQRRIDQRTVCDNSPASKKDEIKKKDGPRKLKVAEKAEENVCKECEGCFRCPFCPRKYQLAKELIDHLVSHNLIPKSKPVAETTSIRSSTESPNQDKNELNKKNLKCPKCNYTFNYNKHLQRHLSTLHNEARPFKCDQCNFFFKTISQKRAHDTTVHNKSNKYTCSVCSKRFNRTKLQIHMLIHTGEKPFKCLLCNIRARQLIHIKRHMHAKHGEIPAKSFVMTKKVNTESRRYFNGLYWKKEGNKFKCPKCPCTERSLQNLFNRHYTKVHDESRPIECANCNNYYKDIGSLRAHVSKVHGKLIVPKSDPC